MNGPLWMWCALSGVLGIIVGIFLTVFVGYFISRDEEEDTSGNIQVFGGTLAIDPADVLSVSIREVESENPAVFARATETSVLLTSGSEIIASEKAGTELIQAVAALSS